MWKAWSSRRLSAALLTCAGGSLALFSATNRPTSHLQEKESSTVVQPNASTKVVSKSKRPHKCSLENRFVPGCGELKVFSGNANLDLAKEIGAALGCGVGKASVSRFADGEVSVKIDESVRGKDVYIVQPTSPPVNESLVEMLLMVSAMRHSSAKRVTVIVPYFGYMRSLSQSVTAKDEKDWNYARSNLAAKDIAHMMEVAGAQRVVSIDMYPPGQGMAEGFFDFAPIEQLRTSETMLPNIVEALEFKEKIKHDDELVVVAPHAACLTKAKLFRNELVSQLKLRIGLATIIRTPPPPNHNEKERKVDLVGNVEGKSVLIVEDLIDSGRTTASAVKAVKNAGAKSVSVFASHALLSSGSIQRLQNANADAVVVLNTLPVSEETKQALPMLKVISVAETLASLIRTMHFEEK